MKKKTGSCPARFAHFAPGEAIQFKSKTLSRMLVILLLLSVLSICGGKGAEAASSSEINQTGAEKRFAAGAGIVEDPWQIATADQLNRVRDDLTAHYVLINDIDLSSYENWVPIGSFKSHPKLF